jgi:hypothetical protein
VHGAGLDVEGHLRGGASAGPISSRAGFTETCRRVVAAVVAALDLHDRLAPGVGAGGADGVHERLGAGVGEAQHVEAEALAEALAISVACGDGVTKSVPVSVRPADRVDDRRD